MKVVIVLALATAAAAVGTDLAKFKCTDKSPVQEPQFSNTNPPVALTHIFCGEITSNGKANGFHSRALINPKDKTPCARAIGNLRCAEFLPMDECRNYCFYSDGIEVYNANAFVTQNRYIQKKHEESKFFPDGLTAPEVVDIALKVYKEGKRGKRKTDICLQTVNLPRSTETTAVKIFTATDDEKKERIISAFPVDDCYKN